VTTAGVANGAPTRADDGQQFTMITGW